MTNLSRSLTFEKMTDSASHPELVAQNRIEAKPFMQSLTTLAGVIQIIIDHYKSSAFFSSGFRGKTLNIKVGSKTLTSQHMYGEAGDFSIIGISPAQLYYDICERKIPDLPYDQLGQVILEKYSPDKPFTWVHLSIFTQRFADMRKSQGKDYSRFQRLVTEDSTQYIPYTTYTPKLNALLNA